MYHYFQFLQILVNFTDTQNCKHESVNLIEIFPTAYLCCAILESFRKSFQLNIPYHTILFSNFLYPVHAMLLTATIYLTVGITFERYEAVHHPVDYNQVQKYYLICKVSTFCGVSRVLIGQKARLGEDVCNHSFDCGCHFRTLHGCPSPG